LESDIIKFTDNLDHKLRYYRLQFAKLKEDKTIKEEIDKVFKKRDIPEIQPFKNVILSYKNSTSDTPQKIKLELQSFIAPMRPAGSRFYLEEKDSRKHFISYYYADTQNGFVYEAVYDYLYYREAIHPEATKFILMMVFVTLFIIVGFRFFFLGALITPLNTLLSGLREIKKGNLNIKLKVQVEDEIGFLTKSFNGMANSIRASKKRLQAYADELEDKVKERTAELTKTLVDVQELKTQQDGDYFLTSLLIKPLGKNYSKSEKVKVEFLISQKKKFKFKKWEEEIGGDLCISYNLLLKNKPVTIFLNADAMGKSMQGAGGALVVGSVFQSIIERTKLNQDVSSTYPEIWLKNAFLELHKVFESFDGSMLVSTVMGIVEEDTGFMYYINAEHPFTILYRDGKADFIETMTQFRKLGTLDIAGKIFVNTFQLMAGDTIVVGSDGRDDVMLGVDEYGNRIINEDETWFLKRIEESNGDINAIYEKMKLISEITDDISLIKITFKPEGVNEIIDNDNEKTLDFIHKSRIAHSKKNYTEAISLLEEALELNRNNTNVVRRLINNYIFSKDYSKAIKIASEFSELHPASIEYLYVQSYCLKKLGSLKQAAEIGERIRVRKPDLINNLSNLSEIYTLLKNFTKAKSIAKKALEIDPNHKRALKILHYIEAKSG
jgi:tetratricopeptide (TPR) repeat protein